MPFYITSCPLDRLLARSAEADFSTERVPRAVAS
jgi:hypothetical protein